MSYVYHTDVPGIYAEVYLPKKAKYQGTIYDSLEEGFDEETVRSYLHRHEQRLREEFRDYRDFDGRHPLLGETGEEATRRISRYRSTFEGYSLYDVNGSFRGLEESVQVVRIMFQCPHSIIPQPRAPDDRSRMLRTLVAWYLDRNSLDRSIDLMFQEFVRACPGVQQPPFSLAREQFEAVLRRVQDWIDNCALFIFCYFVRRFCQRVLETRSVEEQVWVTSFFNLSINIVTREARAQDGQPGRGITGL